MSRPEETPRSAWGPPPRLTYRLWVNDERTLLVRLWEDGGQGHVEVATREAPDHTWGPPTYLTEEVVK